MTRIERLIARKISRHSLRVRWFQIVECQVPFGIWHVVLIFYGLLVLQSLHCLTREALSGLGDFFFVGLNRFF